MGLTFMKKAGLVFFAIDVVKALHAGYTKDHRESIVPEEPEQKTEEHHTATWKSYVGIGMLVLGGAFLILGKKKSSNN